MKTIRFKIWECEIHKERYGNGRTALELVDVTNDDSVAMATVNIPHELLKADEVFIKSWSENEGMAENLQEQGVIGPVLEEVPIGFVTATKHKLLI